MGQEFESVQLEDLPRNQKAKQMHWNSFETVQIFLREIQLPKLFSRCAIYFLLMQISR